MQFLSSLKIIFVSVLVFCVASGCNSETDKTNGSVDHFTLYAVTTGADTLKTETPSLQPIVVVQSGKFSDPVPDPSKDEYDKVLKAAFDRYLSPNGAYHVYRHGQKVGTVAIQRAPEVGENPLLISDAKLNVPQAAYSMALAANTSDLKSHTVRALSASEKGELKNLAKNLFMQNGISGGLLDSVDVSKMYVFDVDGKGTQTFIGNALIVHNKTSPPEESGEGGGEGFVATLEENLFILADKKNGAISILNSHFAPGASDNPDLFHIDFIDALDLDKDGVDEFVVVKSGFESYTFAIMKRRSEKWEEVYKGAGGGL